VVGVEFGGVVKTSPPPDAGLTTRGTLRAVAGVVGGVSIALATIRYSSAAKPPRAILANMGKSRPAAASPVHTYKALLSSEDPLGR
jgi:hypothetical protein